MNDQLLDLLNAVTVAGPDDCIVLGFRELTEDQFRRLRDEINAGPLAGRVLIVQVDEIALVKGIRKGLTV